jgi:hypothetical protein
MARRAQLIIVRASDASVHERWLVGERKFDIMVSYSGNQAGRFSQGVEYYHAMKGPHWPTCHALFMNYLKLLGDYERIAVVYDDVHASAKDWNTLFRLSDWYGLDIVHPSVAGHAATDLTRSQDGSILRYMSVVDCLAPVFSRRGLDRVLTTFGEGASDGELPLRWAERLPWPDYRSAIADAVTVSRTVAAWGSAPRSAPEFREHARLRMIHEEIEGRTV